MRNEWISASSAAWTLGGLTAVLGFAVSPISQDLPLGAAALAAAERDTQWVFSIALLFCAAIGMSAGTLAILYLLRDRSRLLAWNAAGAYLIGSIGMAGQAMLLAFVRALVRNDPEVASQLDAAGADLVLNILLLTWSAGLFAGLLLIAVGLWKSNSTPPWVPTLFVVFVLSQFTPLPGGALVDTLQFVLLAVPIAAASFAAHAQSSDSDVAAEPQHSTAR